NKNGRRKRRPSRFLELLRFLWCRGGSSRWTSHGCSRTTGRCRAGRRLGSCGNGYRGFSVVSIHQFFSDISALAGPQHRRLRVGDIQNHRVAVGARKLLQHLEHFFANAINHFLLGLLDLSLEIFHVSLQTFLRIGYFLNAAVLLIVIELFRLGLKGSFFFVKGLATGSKSVRPLPKTLVQRINFLFALIGAQNRILNADDSNLAWAGGQWLGLCVGWLCSGRRCALGEAGSGEQKAHSQTEREILDLRLA